MGALKKTLKTFQNISSKLISYKKELDAILNYTSGSRNTWLFSATMPEEILRIISKYMEPSAVKVSVNKESLVNANISHQYLITSIKEKTTVVSQLLDKFNEGRGIIFCRTKLGVQKLVKELKEEGFSVDALEGDMQQRDRDKVMRMFKKGQFEPWKYGQGIQGEIRIITDNLLAF